MKFLQIIAAGVALTQTNALAIGSYREARAGHRDADRDFRDSLEKIAIEVGVFRQEEVVSLEDEVRHCIFGDSGRLNT